MKKAIYSLPVKTLAVFLITVLIFICIASTLAIVYMYDLGLYEEDTTYYDTRLCRQISHDYSYQVYDLFINRADSSEWERFSVENSNFVFKLISEDDPELVLAENFDLITKSGYSEFMITTDTGRYIVRSSVRNPLAAHDDYYSSYQFYTQLQPYRNLAIIVLVAGLVVFFSLLIFLMSLAGRRKDQEGVALNLLDKLPFDIYLALAATGFILLALLTAELIGYGYNVGHYNILWGIILPALAGAGAFCCFLAALLTFATRVKAGKWWRNTLIFYILKFIWKILKGLKSGILVIFRNLPILWKVILAYCGAALISFLLLILFYNSSSLGAFFIYAMFNIGLLFTLIYLVLHLDRLKKAGEHLAAGDLDYKVDTKHMFWDLKKHGENLNNIGDGMSLAVNQKMKSERLKTELITNISHDIKTPLTSIINYVDLLEKEDIQGKSAEYLEVLNRQSNRLKKLTEDLVEASKASTGNLNLDLAKTGVSELVNQSLGEYTERLALKALIPVVTLPEEEVYIMADGRLLWRVLDNLLSNACKYSQGGTRVYLDVKRAEGEIVLAIKNISKDKLNIEADELMERFIRGDSARTTEGSGLGLNIARSLVENQGGAFSLVVDGDLFKVEIRFKEVI